jgi:pimeloyl-ACP methyl ester carboxylesterase
MIRQVRSLDVQDTLAIADQIPNIDVPARIVWGATDRFQKIGYGYRLAYELGAPLDRIEEGKHFVPEDHPERVAVAVNDLL